MLLRKTDHGIRLSGHVERVDGETVLWKCFTYGRRSNPRARRVRLARRPQQHRRPAPWRPGAGLVLPNAQRLP
jgi:hypothetical protein